MNITKTQKARTLYDMLRREGLVDIMFDGLMGDQVWITSKRRAYRIDELSDGHLNNIIAKYLERNEKVPTSIAREYDKRKNSK